MTFGPIDPGWARALEPVGDRLAAMADFVDAEIADGREVLPARENVLRAFERPFDDVRVLLVGQDPYPTPGHAVGLSFSVAADVAPVPRSLHNIFTEYVADLDLPRPTTGDLTPWADRGVLLLNRVLTVRPGAAASHRRAGWEAITARAITALAERGRPLVAVLWGRDAATAVPLLGETPVVSSVHPSPLSASRGFFGSRPFSSVNDHLVAMGEQPVDWRLP
ncbi:uracil-DNA glycosylase [Rhodococcoides corynebacterioides]|uniref:uracil-DNA glycosylase n=1 Tax=Rhodococcoides corynebacterioides TaxID=53972 RepID=UPI003AD9223D